MRHALPWLLIAVSFTGATADGAEGPAPLRVGSSGDYAPFSFTTDGAALDGGPYDGFDVALARAFAHDAGRPLELVRVRWPELEPALRDGRFDLAWTGVTMRPDRSLAGRFGVAVAESGAVALVRQGGPFGDLDALARGPARIAVNAGGHLEQVTRTCFPAATVIAVPDNTQVRQTLLDGSADAVVTDSQEAPGWLRGASDLRVLGPFTRDRKAPLLQAEDAELARALDTWLLAREADGTLPRLRREWLAGADAQPTATPLAALLAAIDERFSLMPLVAETKRRTGRAVEDAAQEARVLDAAVRSAREEAQRAGIPAPSDAAVRALFRTLIDAASALQREVLAKPANRAPATDGPDLETVIRPALARVGQRLVFLLVRLSETPPELRGIVRAAIRTPGVRDVDVAAIADAIGACVEASRSPATGPMEPVAPSQ